MKSYGLGERLICVGVIILLSGCFAGGEGSQGTLFSKKYGNAQGYGGTITLNGMTFYSLSANYKCLPQGGSEAIPSYRSAISFSADGSTPYVVLKNDICLGGSSTVCDTLASCPTNLEFPPVYYPTGSAYLMGYRNEIYEQRSVPPSPGSNGEQFVDAWCRSVGANFDEGIDLISRTEIGTGRILMSIIISERPEISDGGGKQVLPFLVTKTEGGYSVGYSADAFKLTIDLDTASGVPGKYTGTLNSVIDKMEVSRSVLCRVSR